VVPLFTDGQPAATRALLRAGFPVLRVAMGRRFEISAESAAHSRAKMVAAMDRLEREISAGGYLVGDSFTVADLTAAALFYGVARPPQFPYPMVDVNDLPDCWREFVDSLAQRPGGQWVAQMYGRHRGQSTELTTGDVKKTARPDARNGESTGHHGAARNSQTAVATPAAPRDPSPAGTRPGPQHDAA
jgi:hypothetical protein